MGKALYLNVVEEEVLILKSALGSIDSMLNFEIVKLYHNDPNSEVQCKSRTHRQYFNIILLDFLQSNIFEVEMNCMEGLRRLCDNPQFAGDVTALKNALCGFQTWLDEDVQLVEDGKIKMFWFP